MRIMEVGGLRRVNGNWQSRRDVPQRLRPYLPPPCNTSGRGGKPVWTLTKSCRTGNRREANRIAEDENHQGHFENILQIAEANRTAAGIDWTDLENRNEHDHTT